MKLIDKDDLVAEIEKLYNGEIDTYTRNILDRLKSNIDTLEVKEFCSMQEKPKPRFHTGDTIRHKEEKDSFKVLAIEDDCYRLENNIVVSIAAQDYWELVEEPATSIWHDTNEVPKQGKDILMLRKEEKDTNYPPIAGCFHGTNYRIDGKNWGYYNGFCYNEIEVPYKWAYVDDLINLTHSEVTKISDQVPVSKDLEEVVKDLWQEINTGYQYSILDSYNQFYGMCLDVCDWQKQQMIDKALDWAKARLTNRGYRDFKKYLENDDIQRHRHNTVL